MDTRMEAVWVKDAETGEEWLIDRYHPSKVYAKRVNGKMVRLEKLSDEE